MPVPALTRMTPGNDPQSRVFILQRNSLIERHSVHAYLDPDFPPLVSFDLQTEAKAIAGLTVRLPRILHQSVGTPILFDVFYRPAASRSRRDPGIPDGFTVNRYRLDLSGRESGSQQLSYSLSIVETLTFTNGLERYSPATLEELGYIDPFHFSGFIQTGGHDSQSGFAVYAPIPHADDIKVDYEAAKSHLGIVSDLARPTTSAAKLTTVYKTKWSDFMALVICGRTGRAVVRTPSGVIDGEMVHRYSVYDYVSG